MSKWHIVASLALDSRTQYQSGSRIIHPTRVYEGRVLRWGSIDRSISTPAGLPQVSDAKIRLADTDRKWRDLLYDQTPRRRSIELKIVESGTSESTANPIYTGEIVNFEFGPGYAECELRDRTFSWLDERFPNLINRTNFPDLAEGLDEAFFNIVNGHVVSLTSNPQGVVPCPHIGFDSTVGDRYAVAIHPVEEILVVYRREPGSGLFSFVSPSEYIVTNGAEDFTPAEIPTLTFQPTYIDFIFEQTPGTEIRCDLDGIKTRPASFGLSASAWPDTKNPVDFLINMIDIIIHKAGQPDVAWDEESFQRIHALFLTAGESSTDTAAGFPLLCDGALTESTTVREFLGRFLASFQLHLYQNRVGDIAINYIAETDSNAPLFREGIEVLRDSFFERLSNPTVNQMIMLYARNYATGEWATKDIFDNLEDQDALGLLQYDSNGDLIVDSSEEPIRDPRIETGEFQLWWVRDDDTAFTITAKRMSFLALGSYRQKFSLPAPEVLEDLDLANVVKLTHSQGLADGGYAAVDLSVDGLTLDLDRLRYDVRTILLIPQEILPREPDPLQEPPGITAIDPDSGPQDAAMYVTISGINMLNAVNVAFSGSGVTATVVSSTETEVVALVVIEEDATLAQRTVTVTTPNGTSDPFTGFDITLRAWTKVGGDGLNNGWDSTHEAISAMQEFDGYIYVGVNDDNVNGPAEVWRRLLTGGDWEDVTPSSGGWPATNIRIDALWVMGEGDEYLYAGFSRFSGDQRAEIWEMDPADDSWRQVGKSGVNVSPQSDITDGKEQFFSFSHSGFNLLCGLGGGNGDAEIWRWDREGGEDWVAIGGEGAEAGDWSSRETTQGNWVTLDGIHLYVGLGNASTDAEVYRYTLGTSGSWVKIGGDGVNGSWNTVGQYFRITGITEDDQGRIYCSIFLGSTTLGAEVWRWDNDASSWEQVGGDLINGSWTTGNGNNRGFNIPNPHACQRDLAGKVYIGLSNVALLQSVWKFDPDVDEWTQIAIAGPGGNAWGQMSAGNGVVVEPCSNGQVYAGILGNASGESEVWVWK